MCQSCARIIVTSRNNIRLASLVTIVSVSGLAGSDGGVVNQLEQVLSVASDNGHLLRVLTKSIELVSESCLQLLAGDVGQLGLGNQRFGFSADKLLLQDNNLGAVGLLVLELGNLISDLLLACTFTLE